MEPSGLGQGAILGISAFYHDSAAALLINGHVVAAAQEERFSRKKHDDRFPVNAVRYCLAEAGLEPKDIQVVAFYDKPILKFERLLETYYAFAPDGIGSFLTAMPHWIGGKLSTRKLLREGLKEVGVLGAEKPRMLFPEHHLSHAASAFYPSPFEEAAILTIDGVGEWSTLSICKGKGRDIEVLKELRFPHSVGLLYSAFTYFLGFRVNSGEYKLMGLAPYGDAASPRVKDYEERIRRELVKVHADGSIWMDQRHFHYAKGLRMVQDKDWEKIFGFPRRAGESPLEQHHCDLALAIQRVTEDIVLRLGRHAREITGCKNLCMAGGVALNCVANGELERSGVFDHIFVQPASGDAGGALGAALATWHISMGKERRPQMPDGMQGAYLGPSYGEEDVRRVCNGMAGVSHKAASEEELADTVAKALSQGQVVGWFQGRMEFGPRALGGRSILGDPGNREMQLKLNQKIKFRESFRPFAPAVTEEDMPNYFKAAAISPYMLMVHPVADAIRKPVPAGYDSMPVREKLYVQRSTLPAITHIDMSARVQSVSKATNPRFHRLIKAFERYSGYPVVINTSFNVRGEPIVCTPMDAYRCFMRTEMDMLVIGEHVFHRNEQPPWPEGREWMLEHTLD